MKNNEKNTSENYFCDDNFNLINLLYTSPAKIYSWFIANSVNIDYKDCEKMFLAL